MFFLIKKRVLILTAILMVSIFSVSGQVDWEVNPHDYVSNMTMTGVVSINDSIYAHTSELTVGAFTDDGVCVGVAEASYYSKVQKYRVPLMVYSNTEATTFTLKVYLAESNTVLGVDFVYTFISDESSGNFVEPIVWESFVYDHYITFQDWDSTILSLDGVVSGGDATAPPAPSRDAYTFVGWDAELTNVTDSYTVTALYVANSDDVFNVDFVISESTSSESMSLIIGDSIYYITGGAPFVVELSQGVYKYSLQSESFLDKTGMFSVIDSDVTISITRDVASLSGVAGTSLVNVYPNPATNYVEVAAPVGSSYCLMNLSGSPILSGKFIEKSQMIDISSLTSGMYLMQVENEIVRLLVQ